jgi:hypothetical protein
MRFSSVRAKVCRMVFLLSILTLIYALRAGAENYLLPEMDPSGFPAPDTGCLASGQCHAVLEPIRAHNSGMAKQIYERGRLMGDPNGCVVCHGVNPEE